MLQTYKTILTNKTQLNPYTILFHFQLVEPKEISFIAGQYVILMVPQSNGEYIRRLYSIASSDAKKDSFELLVHIVPDGMGGKYFSSLNINDRVMFQGPAGMFTLKNSNKDIVFLTTGCGISPVRSMLKSISNKFEYLNSKSQINSKSEIQNSKHLDIGASNLEFRIYLFWGMPYYQDVYLLEELKNLKSKIKNFDFKICLSREQNLDMIPEDDRKYFSLGRVTKQVDKPNNSDYYLCAGREVIDSLRMHLDQIGAPKEQVFFEKF